MPQNGELWITVQGSLQPNLPAGWVGGRCLPPASACSAARPVHVLRHGPLTEALPPSWGPPSCLCRQTFLPRARSSVALPGPRSRPAPATRGLQICCVVWSAGWSLLLINGIQQQCLLRPQNPSILLHLRLDPQVFGHTPIPSCKTGWHDGEVPTLTSLCCQGDRDFLTDGKS